MQQLPRSLLSLIILPGAIWNELLSRLMIDRYAASDSLILAFQALICPSQLQWLINAPARLIVPPYMKLRQPMSGQGDYCRGPHLIGPVWIRRRSSMGGSESEFDPDRLRYLVRSVVSNDQYVHRTSKSESSTARLHNYQPFGRHSAYMV